MTRALVIHAHPCEESFARALYDRTVRTLGDRGWDVDALDLYGEAFQPVLSAEERRGYHEEDANIAPVQDYVDRLRAADAMVLCFPVWNFGFPAILKGFLDRVFLPGVSFRLEDGKVKPNLTNIRKLAAITTYGGTRTRALMAGDPPRKCVTRAIWHVCRPEKMRYLALYDMNRATDDKRRGFDMRITQEMQTF